MLFWSTILRFGKTNFGAGGRARKHLQMSMIRTRFPFGICNVFAYAQTPKRRGGNAFKGLMQTFQCNNRVQRGTIQTNTYNLITDPIIGRHSLLLASSRLLLGVLVCWVSLSMCGEPSLGFSSAQFANIYICGEDCIVPFIKLGPGWRLLDYEGGTVRAGRGGNGRFLQLGRLGVGYYKLVLADPGLQISLAVVAPLRVPTPSTSPIGVEFWRVEGQPAATVLSLAKVAGANWLRETIDWPTMEPSRGKFAKDAQPEKWLQEERAAGFRVLRFATRAPDWAGPNRSRFPGDLRDVFFFFRELAGRCEGDEAAIEPWNEADFPRFGGHTGSEMASFQKAAYLGLKAAKFRGTVCENPFAFSFAPNLVDFEENRTFPYFDTYNFHHYEKVALLPALYAAHRRASGGKPMWVSECGRPVWCKDDPIGGEPTEKDLRLQSENVVKAFACALHEGASKVFYFSLQNYVENKSQYGLLHSDLTPRPGYVSLCAVGRLLADAKPLGEVRTPGPNGRGYLFSSRPDGKRRDVLVVWSTNETWTLRLPCNPIAIFDHLGRALPASSEIKVSSAPLFIILPQTVDRRLRLVPPPEQPPEIFGRPCPVVFQSVAAEKQTSLNNSAYLVPRKPSNIVHFYAYNFSNRFIRGNLKILTSKGWRAVGPKRVAVPPMGREELPISIDGTEADSNFSGRLLLKGEFGWGRTQILSIRLIAGS